VNGYYFSFLGGAEGETLRALAIAPKKKESDISTVQRKGEKKNSTWRKRKKNDPSSQHRKRYSF